MKKLDMPSPTKGYGTYKIVIFMKNIDEHPDYSSN